MYCAPGVGIEPTHSRLTAARSASELPRKGAWDHVLPRRCRHCASHPSPREGFGCASEEEQTGGQPCLPREPVNFTLWRPAVFPAQGPRTAFTGKAAPAPEAR